MAASLFTTLVLPMVHGLQSFFGFGVLDDFHVFVGVIKEFRFAHRATELDFLIRAVVRIDKNDWRAHFA